VTLPTSSSAPIPRFHVGQPIRVSWTAPSNHSRKDWIGIYRYGSCKSQLVTRISSLSKWMPIYEEEWDGDTPVNSGGQMQCDAGELVFRGNQLPWAPGRYELRYHHDGKHNVMSRVAPIDIYGEPPLILESYKLMHRSVTPPADDSLRAVHSTLLNIVRLSLDSDPSLIPTAAKLTPDPDSGLHTVSEYDDAANTGSRSPRMDWGSEDGRDPDDFIIMSDQQAKRIVSMSEMAFGVELSPDVVVADANVGAITRRVVGAWSLIGEGGGRNGRMGSGVIAEVAAE